MAVVRIGPPAVTPHVYLGLSSDTKPTTDVPAGARFWETDTGLWFQYDGTAWTAEFPKAASVVVSEGINTDQENTVPGATGLRLVGWSARESAGTPAVATFGIMNGATVAGGANILRVELAANESSGEWYGPEGIDAANGLTIDHIAGTFDLYLYHKTMA